MPPTPLQHASSALPLSQWHSHSHDADYAVQLQPSYPLPPSPTLTNPDNILPSTGLPLVNSPPRLTRRPPSPSYLRDGPSDTPRYAAAAMGRKEKLGLMSRKMMLLRTRTASGGNVHAIRVSPASVSNDLDYLSSSPVLQDVGNLAPEQHSDHLQPPEMVRRSNSAGSSSSDISGMTTFLAKYGKSDGASDDEVLQENGDSSPVTVKYEDSIEDHDSEAYRRQQEEYNSAVLSKRAEEILANAKKRLNVMEGNLRGARDLVAPLTAANLKRATSLGSAGFSPAFGPTRRYASNLYEYTEEDRPSSRRLQTQSSSPTMGRDYQSHSRGFSETEIPERPYTSLESPRLVMSRNYRMSGRAAEVSGLRESRSYDSLDSSLVDRDRPLHVRDHSESSQLEPLQEVDENRKSFRNSRYGNDSDYTATNGLGLYRPSSRTSDLREQMTNLKGKISTLKERARKDSLRRQSQSSLRNASPLNNAVAGAGAPELYYNPATTYESPPLDNVSGSESPASAQRSWENGTPMQGSRNAFAEQAAAQKQSAPLQARIIDIVAPKTPDSKYQVRSAKALRPQAREGHRRTASGTAIVDPAKKRYSHHQPTNSQEMPGTYVHEDDFLDMHTPEVSTGASTGSALASSELDDEDDSQSEYEASVYEDAQSDQTQVVAHEDREDAFDYENFFLHSAMGSYSNGRRGSDSSEASMSSVSTAKGPAVLEDDDDDDLFNQESELFPPPTPETPEQLKMIERNLHKRISSSESLSTLATFATADEDPEDPVSPIDEASNRLSTISRRAVSPIESDPLTNHRQISSRPASQQHPHPGTVVKSSAGLDNSSDGADSGVGGLSHRHIGSTDSQRTRAATLTPKQSNGHVLGSALGTPPTSPRGIGRQDPATVAVNALLDPNGKSLGLRNKATLFGVVESLRKVVHDLQCEEDADQQSRQLRKRLDAVKMILDGSESRLM